jgi:alkylation response protein AidB-like acyl-CoA dehydrogenase
VDLRLREEQQDLVSSFAGLLAKAAGSERVRAAEPLGHDPELWRVLRETGVVTTAVPEAAGGWGAGLLDLALVAEQVGRAAAPAPVVDAQVAARLLAVTGAEASRALLGRALEGDRLGTLAVRPVEGDVATLVPAGAVCDAVVFRAGDSLRVQPVTDDDRRAVANLGSSPLADVRVAGGELVAQGPEAVAWFERAIDEWLALTAASLVGLAAAALDLACAYARERHAFGQAIGSFQGIAHPLADDATNVDGARLLAQKAAWALDEGHSRARELAAMAFAFAARTAEKATYDALHTHGGYGFMLEYDVQLHWRRARAWARVWGDAEAAYDRAASARYGRTA